MSRPIQEIREDIAAIESLIKAQLHLERADEDNLLDRCAKRLNALLTEIEERAEHEPEKDDTQYVPEHFKKFAEEQNEKLYNANPTPCPYYPYWQPYYTYPYYRYYVTSDGTTAVKSL